MTITLIGFLTFYHGATLLRASEVMRRDFPVAKPDDLMIDVVKRFIDHEYGGAVVVDEHGHLEGIVTERDALRLIASGKKLEETKVSDVMRRTVVVVNKDVPLKMVLQLFGAYRIRRLPVLDDSKVIGVISSTDVVYKAIPKILHVLSGRIEEAAKELPYTKDDIVESAKVLVEAKSDGALINSSTLISERSVLKAYLEGKRPSEVAERYIVLPPETPLKFASETMALNEVRFVRVGMRSYAFTRDIAVRAAEMAESTLKGYIMVKVKPGYESVAIQELSELPRVVSVELTTGPFDLVITALTESTEGITELVTKQIRGRDYVLDTLTLIVLQEGSK
ncbi:inosine-5-monophosphate dehydrogenase [Ignicoccus pacificus DSM 13166]|uniref:Inosine-5-monophosphate dehydrogenase n=1 Tax=Ignicoccus pacificus DSM 13166 TaxID=940294 RepID=A0A977K8X5_9CREN|nr:inosine-5-monophosphate dehydrogenase [Ignicoccus pacificus DSM 13166]